MALLAEQIVQEWLTRKGYFTMRGIKLGIHEIDLLAAKHFGEGKWEHQHVEVQVSFRPVGYITGKGAKTKSNEELEATVKDWVYKKFHHPEKVLLRKELSNSNNWEYIFVHGVVRSQEEINFINQMGVKTIRINDVMKELIEPIKKADFTTYAATDILELLSLNFKE